MEQKLKKYKPSQCISHKVKGNETLTTYSLERD